LQAAVGGAALIAAGDVPIRLQRAAAAGGFLHAPSLHARAGLASADRRVFAIGRAQLAWLLITAAVFVVWMVFAYADLVRSGARHQMPVALAAAAPFIPVASLVLLPRAMDDLARQSRFARTSRVGWWFGTYLVAGATGYLAIALLSGRHIVDYQRSDRVFAAGDVLEVAAAVLLIGLLEVITDRADVRRREAAAQSAAPLAVDPEAAGGALGWYRDPRRQAEVRWWDGVEWTDQVASARDAPPPVRRIEHLPSVAAATMPRSAKLCLFAGFVAVLVLPAPLVLALGLWALGAVRRRPGAGGRARAWFAIVSGGLFTLLLVLAIAFG
jgi:hypothetical protein